MTAGPALKAGKGRPTACWRATPLTPARAAALLLAPVAVRPQSLEMFCCAAPPSLYGPAGLPGVAVKGEGAATQGWRQAGCGKERRQCGKQADSLPMGNAAPTHILLQLFERQGAQPLQLAAGSESCNQPVCCRHLRILLHAATLHHRVICAGEGAEQPLLCIGAHEVRAEPLQPS